MFNYFLRTVSTKRSGAESRHIDTHRRHFLVIEILERRRLLSGHVTVSGGIAHSSPAIVSFAPNTAPKPKDTTPLSPIVLSQIEKIVPPPKKASYYNIASLLVQYLNSVEAQQTYQINTRKRQAAFIGQVAVETKSLTTLTEDPSRFPSSRSRYKGRGLIQLTGKPNYAAASLGLGLGDLLVTSPNLVASNPVLAAETAGWYWYNHTLNTKADGWDIAGISRAVVGPNVTVGNIARRQHASNVALEVLTVHISRPAIEVAESL